VRLADPGRALIAGLLVCVAANCPGAAVAAAHAEAEAQAKALADGLTFLEREGDTAIYANLDRADRTSLAPVIIVDIVELREAAVASGELAIQGRVRIDCQGRRYQGMDGFDTLDVHGNWATVSGGPVGPSWRPFRDWGAMGKIAKSICR
jgi:hypothetical protein